MLTFFVVNNALEASITECFNRVLESKRWGYFTIHNTFNYI